jgi:WD40 repeat protein
MWIQKVPGGGVDALAFSPDGRTLYTSDRGDWLTAWDTVSRTGRRVVHRSNRYGRAPLISVLPDGQRILAVFDTITTLDAATGAELSRVECPEIDLLGNPRICPGWRVYARHDSKSGIAGWNALTGAPEPLLTSPRYPGYVCEFDFSPDDKLVVISYGGEPTVLFERQGSELRNPIKLPALEKCATDVRFSPDGGTLVFHTNLRPAELTLWDVAAGRPRARKVPCCLSDTFAFNPAFPVFAGLGANDALTIFSLETGQPIRSLDFALGRYVRCVCFSPDGLTCAVGGSNKQFAVFDVDL